MSYFNLFRSGMTALPVLYKCQVVFWVCEWFSFSERQHCTTQTAQPKIPFLNIPQTNLHNQRESFCVIFQSDPVKYCAQYNIRAPSRCAAYQPASVFQVKW